MQSPAVIYLKTRLYRDFHENAASIIQSIDEQVATRFRGSRTIREKMDNCSDAHRETIDSFQFILDQLIYPFMACSEAMIQNGVEKEMVKRYVLRVWEELPEKMMDTIIEKATAGRVNEGINAYLAGVRSGLVIPLFDR